MLVRTRFLLKRGFRNNNIHRPRRSGNCDLFRFAINERLSHSTSGCICFILGICFQIRWLPWRTGHCLWKLMMKCKRMNGCSLEWSKRWKNAYKTLNPGAEMYDAYRSHELGTLHIITFAIVGSRISVVAVYLNPGSVLAKDWQFLISRCGYSGIGQVFYSGFSRSLDWLVLPGGPARHFRTSIAGIVAHIFV